MSFFDYFKKCGFHLAIGYWYIFIGCVIICIMVILYFAEFSWSVIFFFIFGLIILLVCVRIRTCLSIFYIYMKKVKLFFGLNRVLLFAILCAVSYFLQFEKIVFVEMKCFYLDVFVHFRIFQGWKKKRFFSKKPKNPVFLV